MMRSVRGGGCRSAKTISLTKRIRTSWLPIQNSLSLPLYLSLSLSLCLQAANKAIERAALLRTWAADSNDLNREKVFFFHNPQGDIEVFNGFCLKISSIEKLEMPSKRAQRFMERSDLRFLLRHREGPLRRGANDELHHGLPTRGPKRVET